MNRIYNYLKNEMDVEVLTCAHVLSLIIIYGIQKFFIQQYEIEFLYIIEMFAMTYIGAWSQRLLFIKKTYSKRSNITRTLLWLLIPIVVESLCIYLFGWYHDFPAYAPVVMILFIVFYYIVMWVVLRKFYNSETIQLNGMLHEYQINQNLKLKESDSSVKGDNE